MPPSPFLKFGSSTYSFIPCHGVSHSQFTQITDTLHTHSVSATPGPTVPHHLDLSLQQLQESLKDKGYEMWLVISIIRSFKE